MDQYTHLYRESGIESRISVADFFGALSLSALQSDAHMPYPLVTRVDSNVARGNSMFAF